MGLLFDDLFPITNKKEYQISNQYETTNNYQTINNTSTIQFGPNTTVKGLTVDQGGSLSNSAALGQQLTPTQQQNDPKTDGSSLWFIAAAAVVGIIVIKTL